MEEYISSKKLSESGCCVPGCRNYGKKRGVHFYSFSNVSHKKPQTEKWIKAIRRVDEDGTPWRPNKGSRICSQHFIGNKKSEHPLSPSFVPSIFPEVYYGKQMNEATQKLLLNRFQRTMKRQMERKMETLDNNNKKKNIEPQENYNLIIIKSELDIKDEPVDVYSDKETQVDFLEPPDPAPLTFICNNYFNDSRSDASTQAYIPLIKKFYIAKQPKLKLVEKGCGTRELGPDFEKLNSPVISKPPDGFLGMSSVVCDQELLDLAGLRLDAFNIILNVLKEAEKGYGQKISLDNRLLIFFMRIKTGLSFSALSVLFKVHRTSISRTYQSISQALMKNFKDYVTWRKEENAMLITDFRAVFPELLKAVYAKHKPGHSHI
ncbi:uncharacterized protein LOC123269773 [Cotesia glomerata]|uniref:THAP-type domain-containing protein n=1 Tax=Cotesia glomerata TaxID=32391 RepID=A0AAV7J6G4_COTGL|nr:uncharacterized protein LOC123269773 [Cotesia glomerata]KAH0568630.1 hypothetical protein KQX54_021318 [Cotesia glomerata]